MTVNTSDKESLGKGQLGKKLLVKDRILSKITFTTSSNHQRPTDQNRNGDILMVQQQSELTMVKEPDKPLGGKQRSYQRWLDKRIYETEMKYYWAVLGSRGWREKILPTAISMQLFGVFFSTFCWQKMFF